MPSKSREVLGRGSIYTLATAAPVLTGVMILPIITRQLSIIEYGHVAVAIVVVQLGVGVAGLGLPTAIIRHALVADSGPAGARGIALFAAGLAATAATISVGALLLWGWVSGTDGVAIFAIACVAAGAGAISANVQAYCLATRDAWTYVAIAFGLSLGAPLAGLGAVLVFGPSATQYMTGFFAIYVVVAAFTLAKVVRTRPIVLTRQDASQALHISLPMLPYLLSIGLVPGSMILVAAHMLGPAAGAEIQVAINVGSVPLIITSAINNAWMPAILSTSEGTRGAHLEETASDVAWLAAIGGGGVALLSPWLLQFVSSEEYNRAAMVPVAAILGLVAPVASAFLADSQLVLAAGATRVFAYASPMALALGVAAGALFAQVVGLGAFACGFVVVYAVLALATRAAARRYSATRWRHSVIIAPVVVALASASLGVFLPTSGEAALWRLVVAALLAGVAMHRIRKVFGLASRHLTTSRRVKARAWHG